MKQPDPIPCAVCKSSFTADEMYPMELVQPGVARLIAKDHPNCNHASYICFKDLNKYRVAYLLNALKKERKGELTELEEDVVKSFVDYDIMSQNVVLLEGKPATFGQRVADTVAKWGGSWGFIGFFVLVLVSWIIINVSAFFSPPYDPYPFILLNLVLSCIAALQAPIIMMSQNRAAVQDRLRAENDYRVNLKAELEVRYLNERVDHMLVRQWQRMMHIEQMQEEIQKSLLERSRDTRE
jgi:uncharacterized membrane protein